MPAPDRDGHPADPDRDRIAAERAEVQRFDRDAFVETEMAQAAGFGLVEDRPVDAEDTRLGSDGERVEACGVRLKGRVQCCE